MHKIHKFYRQPFLDPLFQLFRKVKNARSKLNLEILLKIVQFLVKKGGSIFRNLKIFQMTYQWTQAISTTKF